MNDILTRTLNTHYRKPKKCVVHTTQADEKQPKNHKHHNTPQKTKKIRNTHHRKPKKCVVHKTQADQKQHKHHKNHNTPQKTKKMKDTDSTNKLGGETMCSRRLSNLCLLLDTRCAARIVKYSTNHVGDKFYIKKTRRFIAIYKWIFPNVHQVCASNG